ncbi:MAG: hypothetical protein LBM01_01120 [Christensenellaceae bacterium]|nr:hypothetical protein [Christensenellaceae bacterium]
MGKFFLFMVVFGVFYMCLSAPESVLEVCLNASASSISMAVVLLGIYMFWMGLLQVAKDAGLIEKLARLMRPFLRFLFGKQSAQTNEYIATNISANLVGAGGAATPAAINAMAELEKEANVNAKTPISRATPPMIMLFILSATAIQLLPTTIISILSSNGATNPEKIIMPTILVSVAATILGVFLVKLFCANIRGQGREREQKQEQKRGSTK